MLSKRKSVIKFASQLKNNAQKFLFLLLHFSIQILFIKFKSPRFVRIRAFFFTPKSSQQANESTGQQANRFSEV